MSSSSSSSSSEENSPRGSFSHTGASQPHILARMAHKYDVQAMYSFGRCLRQVRLLYITFSASLLLLRCAGVEAAGRTGVGPGLSFMSAPPVLRVASHITWSTLGTGVRVRAMCRREATEMMAAGGKKKAGGGGGMGKAKGGFGGGSSKGGAAGAYDLNDMYRRALDCPTCDITFDDKDFMSTCVKLSQEQGTHVGLVAANDIQAGELLLASKAFAIAFEAEYGNVVERLHGEVVTPDESALAAKIQEKVTALGVGEASVKTVASMYAGNRFTHPSDAYRAALLGGKAIEGAEEQLPELERERILGIIKCNAFSTGASFGFAADPRSPMLLSRDQNLGLWVLPAMLNHACVGNCQRFFLGDFMFIRATEDIKAGQELCHSYVDPYGDYAARQRHTQSFGFECKCPLCIQDVEFQGKSPDAYARAEVILEDYRAGELSKLLRAAATGKKEAAEAALAPMTAAVEGLEASLANVRMKRVLLRPAQSLAMLHETLGDSKTAAEMRVKAYESAAPGIGATTVSWAVEAMISFAKAGLKEDAQKWKETARSTWKTAVGDLKLFNLLYGKVVQYYLPQNV